MLKPHSRNGRFWYPIRLHPLARVLKFRKVLQYLDEVPHGKRVLDYGSGDRPYEELLLRKFEVYTAADYAAANQRHSRRPDVYIQDTKVPVADGSVDCVMLTEVLEHIYEPKRALLEIWRMLKPGGVALGSVPFLVGEHEEPYDFHRYTYFCLKRMFEETGFRVERLDYIGEAFAALLATWAFVWSVLPRALRRLRLGWIATLVAFAFKIPEMVYAAVSDSSINPQKLRFTKALPLGYTFMVSKPDHSLPAQMPT